MFIVTSDLKFRTPLGVQCRSPVYGGLDTLPESQFSLNIALLKECPIPGRPGSINISLLWSVLELFPKERRDLPRIDRLPRQLAGCVVTTRQPNNIQWEL